MKTTEAIMEAIRAAMVGSVQDVGERPANVRDAWEGWPGPDPQPRRRRPSRWGWKDGKRHD